MNDELLLNNLFNTFNHSKNTRKVYKHTLTKYSTYFKMTLRELLMEADITRGQIRKDRYCLTYNNLYYEIDIYPFWKDKAIMEIELKHEDDIFEIPKFIQVIKEVTGDSQYYNYNIAETLKK